ncbi:MAG: hypothetical protein ACK51F_04525 [Rhodospirillales bacterium]|jgi:hypothetical protein
MLRRLLLLAFLVVVLGAALGIAALGFVDLPVPTERVEKAIPGDRLPR